MTIPNLVLVREELPDINILRVQDGDGLGFLRCLPLAKDFMPPNINPIHEYALPGFKSGKLWIQSSGSLGLTRKFDHEFQTLLPNAEGTCKTFLYRGLPIAVEGNVYECVYDCREDKPV